MHSPNFKRNGLTAGRELHNKSIATGLLPLVSMVLLSQYPSSSYKLINRNIKVFIGWQHRVCLLVGFSFKQRESLEIKKTRKVNVGKVVVTLEAI